MKTQHNISHHAMMIRWVVSLAVALLAVSMESAISQVRAQAGTQVLLSEDFEAYATQEVFEAVWHDTKTSVYYLDTSFGNPGQSLAMPSPTVNGLGRYYKSFTGKVSATPSQSLLLSFDFWLDPAGEGSLWNGARHWVALQGYSGGQYGVGTLEDQVWFGVSTITSNTQSNRKYQCYVSPPRGSIMDLILDDTAAYTLDEEGSPDRSSGWHRMSIEITATEILFIVDSTLAGIKPCPGPLAFDAIVLGSDITANSHKMRIDNVTVSLATPDLLVSQSPVIADEGSTTGFTISPSSLPVEPLVVTVERLRGDNEITIVDGSQLSFNSTDPQTVTIASAEDADFLHGIATLCIRATGMHDQYVTILENDNDPVPQAVFVRYDATGDNNGTSWENAFRDLQDGLDAAANRPEVTQIWVGKGTYKPSRRWPDASERSATYRLRNRLAIYGGFDGTENNMSSRNPKVNTTILSGDLNGDDDNNFSHISDNAFHVVTGRLLEESALLDGFTIQGGAAGSSSGGGIYCRNAAVALSNCVLQHNNARYGAAADCQGGGILKFTNCAFLHNQSEYYGGAARLYAEAATQNTIFTNCLFLGNHAMRVGGAIYLNTLSRARLLNCVFSGNSASLDGGALYGSSSCMTTWVNCSLSGNRATGSGGGIYTKGTTYLTSSILWGNQDGSGTGQSAQMNISNVWPTINYSCIQGWTGAWGGTANSSTDPLFVDADGPDNIAGTVDDNLRLSTGSACIDAGNNDVDTDLSTAGIQLLPNIDADLNHRRVDDAATVDTGSGSAPIIDMGAYEYGSTPVSRRLFVKANANGANTGADWIDAMMDLQVALQTAGNSGGWVAEIWVAAGIYTPAEPLADRKSCFHPYNNLSVRGGFAGNEDPSTFDLSSRDFMANETILTGDLSRNDGLNYSNMEENTIWVVKTYRENATAVWDGFTISGAYNNLTSGIGAGMYLSGGGPVVFNCRLAGNKVTGMAGGLFCYQQANPTFDNLVIDENSAPAGEAGVIWDSTINLQGALVINAGTLYIERTSFQGPGYLDLAKEGATLQIGGMPTDAASVVRSNIRGLGKILINSGQQLILDGNACIDMRADGQGVPCSDPCVTPATCQGGSIIIDGTLLVQGNATIQNAKVTVRQAQITSNQPVQFNDIHLVDTLGSGGELFVQDNATVSNNVITSEGDRYLDLDPDPQLPTHPFIDHNQINVLIKTDPAQMLGTLLELRSRDDECQAEGVNPTCLSGAFQAAVSGRFDTEPAQNWTLESLDILAGAKLNLTNRPGFQFQLAGTHETAYVSKIKLHPGAVLNTALQTIYYEQLLLVDEQGGETPWISGQPYPESFPNGSQIVDVPLLGFPLGIVAMNDLTASPFNEFDIRVRQRLRDASDVQPDLPAPPLEGAISLLPNARGLGDGAMEMRTQADNKQPASSVAAKGSFARAGEENVVVAFEYHFFNAGDAGDAEIVAKLSDNQDVGVSNYEVARVRPPAVGQPGAIDSGTYAMFYLEVPYEQWSAHLDKFVRGTYIELELRGKGAVVRIDNWDPQVICSYTCADFTKNGVSEDDFLILLAEYGRSPAQTGHSCLDMLLARDQYLNMSDLLAWDTYVSGGFNSCGSGGSMTSLPAAKKDVSGKQTTSSPPSPNTLLVSGKPDTAPLPGDRQRDVLYSIQTTGSCSASGITPAGGASTRANGRLIRDSDGHIYQLHGTRGLVRLDDGVVVIPAKSRDTGGLRWNNNPVSVGTTASGGTTFTGIPISDAVFHPTDSTIVYVTPVLVWVSSPAHTYRATAKLVLNPNNLGQYSLAQIYGMDPYNDPNSNTTTPPEASPYNIQKIREIKIDRTGSRLFVTSAQGMNNNEWLLVYDMQTGGETRIRLTDLNASLKSPEAMFVSSRDKLYLSTSADISARLFRLNITGSPQYEGEVSLPDMRQITSITENPVDGKLYVLGFQAPTFSDSKTFTNADPIFTAPRLATITPAGTWASSTVEAVTVSGANLALPTSAMYIPGNATSPADFNGDSHVDAADLTIFVACGTGPAITYNAQQLPSGCSPMPIGQDVIAADFDSDGDVDSADFAVLQRCFSGLLPD